MTDYLDTLSDFAATTSYEDLSVDAINAAREVILDTVGAIVAGYSLPENMALAKLAATRSAPQTSTILGAGLKAEPMWATLANGTAGVGLEMDEGNRYGGGHPSIHVLPAALSVGEELHSSGKKLIESLIVGYEVSSRLGTASRPRKNVHSHGHWGTPGAAVAVAKLSDYSANEIRSIINISTSMSPANSWTPCFEGATIRNAYSGRSGFQGILAVHMYEAGFTGIHDAPSDIFGSILGDTFEPDKAVLGLGDIYRIQQNYFKFHACCRYNHPTLDAVMDINQRDSFKPNEVEEVQVVTIGGIPEGMVGPYPPNMLSAKFNIPYAVASALVLHATDITAFYDSPRTDKDIVELSSKVNVTLDPNMTMSRDDQPCAEVKIVLRDGRVLEETTTSVRGDAANPVTHQQLIEKFMFITQGNLDKETARSVVKTIDCLETLGDVNELTSLLSGQALGGQNGN